MNEEIEYAEMLEIPVSTVNVIRKKNRRLHVGNPTSLKERLISRVNDRVGEETSYQGSAPTSTPTENDRSAAEEAVYDAASRTDTDEWNGYAEGGERLETVRLSGRAKRRGIFGKKRGAAYADEEYGETNGAATFRGRRGMEEYDAPSRKAGVALTVEFALACALCGTIFLTNVFMPTSAINTFFRGLMPTGAATDARTYTDFELTGVVSEFSDVSLSLSPAGVLSFTGECSVYPAAEGKISGITQNGNGTYEVKIAHTDTFYGVISGLDQVYYAVGDEVESNVPVGYSKGETEVHLTMYSGDQLLTCYTVDEQNCLAWTKAN